MKIVFCNENNRDYQYLLNNLLKDIFLDFQFWYDLNLWDENYESYGILNNGELVSNVCIYKTNVIVKGKVYLALSVGAVATKKPFRGQGLSRKLMEHVIEKYKNTPMYLTAHDGVADFYPKFGFKRINERQPVYYGKVDNTVAPQKLKYNDPIVWRYIYERVNFSQQFDCLNTASINIFHIYWGYLKDSLYFIPKLDTLVIAQQEKEILKIFGVFSRQHILFQDLIKKLPFADVKKIEFAFTPYWPDLKYTLAKSDGDQLYARALKCELGNFKFPELSLT